MKAEKRPLTPEQEHFCVLYTSKGDYSKKGYKCYAEAYGHEIPTDEKGQTDFTSTPYKTCVTNASRLLIQQNISDRIKEIYIDKFNDISNADARIQDIIETGKDTDAIQAVKVLNDIKQRITKKIDITTAGRPMLALSDDELKALID